MQDDKPVITFPCSYPIKVLGEHGEDFASYVLEIVQRHDPEVRETHLSCRASRNGNYVSVNITITATGTDQLKALFEDLKASGRVSLVL